VEAPPTDFFRSLLEEELRRIAQQFEHLANDVAAEPELRNTEVSNERN